MRIWKSKHLGIAGGNANGAAAMENSVWQLLTKATELSYKQAIPLLGNPFLDS